MSHIQNTTSPSFLDILTFLDTKTIEYTGSQDAFVKTIGHATSVEQQMMALMRFITKNSAAWKSDMFMDIDKCKDKNIIITDGCVIKLDEIFKFLSEHDRQKFWIMVCMCIGRTSTAIAETRSIMLQAAVEEFSSDLEKINFSVSHDDIIQLVSTNTSAISTRLVAKLNVKVPLEKQNYDPFWEHMENIYNIMNPYNQILFVSSKSHNIVSKIVDTVSDAFNNGDGSELTPQTILQTLMNQDIFGELGKMMEGGNAGEIISDLLKSLPQLANLNQEQLD